jgi:hypothetical protein
MWTWVLAAYLVTLIVLVGCAGYLALVDSNERRADRALHILKITIAAFGGNGGVLVLIMRLDELGILG